MANRPAPALVLRDGDRETRDGDREKLERLTRSSTVSTGAAQRPNPSSRLNVHVTRELESAPGQLLAPELCRTHALL